MTATSDPTNNGHPANAAHPAYDEMLAARFASLDKAPEDASIVTIPEIVGPFIDGKFEHGGVGEMASTNPANGRELYRLAVCGPSELDRAVAAARRAQPAWAALAPIERAKYLYRVARRLAENARLFAVAETLDGGKPIRETRDVDVPLASQHFFSHAGWCDKLDAASLGRAPRPLGVVGQIIPWNFPLLMAAWKIAPALALGNTVVLKPAETTSLSAHLLASLFADAGLPDGVVNIVTGDGTTGALLAGHAGIDKVAFTGSTAVGRRIAAELAGTGRRLTLELGGKGANVVFADANVDVAVEGIVSGIFFNQGHVCCAGSRLLVAESVHDELVERLIDRIGRIRVGDPMDKNTEMGAINSAGQLARIEQLVELGVRDGAERVSAASVPAVGCFYPPTLLLGVESSNPVFSQEVFGPVLSLSTFRSTQEAVDLANHTPYGLSAGVWTTNADRAAKVASQLQAGVVWMNSFNVFDPTAAFGGFKESGFGREGGRAGLEAYCG